MIWFGKTLLLLLAAVVVHGTVAEAAGNEYRESGVALILALFVAARMFQRDEETP